MNNEIIDWENPHMHGVAAKDNRDKPSRPHVPAADYNVIVPQDRGILILLAVKDNKTIIEMEGILGLSRAMIQRYLYVCKELGYVEFIIGGKSGRKSKNRGRILTDTGKKLLRDYGHQV